MKKYDSNVNYNFYAGQLDQNDLSKYQANHELFEFEDDLFDDQVSFSAFGDDLSIRGKGVLVDDPKGLFRVDLGKDKSFLKNKRDNMAEVISDKHSVIVAHVRACSDRHQYYDKDGQKKTFKRYGIVPIFANSETAKRLLAKFAKGDKISFTGAFITKVAQDEEGNYTNKATFWCILREFSGNPVNRKKRLLRKALRGISNDNSQGSVDHVARKYEDKAVQPSSDSSGEKSVNTEKKSVISRRKMYREKIAEKQSSNYVKQESSNTVAVHEGKNSDLNSKKSDNEGNQGTTLADLNMDF